MSGGTLQYTQAGVAGLTGSQEFVTAAGASQQYTYPTSPPQQSAASPQHQPQQNPGSPRSPGGQHQPLPSPTHQQGQQPPQAMPSPTHTSMLPPPQDQPLALVQQQHQQQQNQQPQQQANNKIPDIILTGSTATTLADLEEILSCRESTLHGQYSLLNIY